MKKRGSEEWKGGGERGRNDIDSNDRKKNVRLVLTKAAYICKRGRGGSGGEG